MGPRPFVAALAATLAMAIVPGLASAQSQVCLGLLPLAVVPPPGQTDFQTGCGTVYRVYNGAPSPEGNCGGVVLPACDAGACPSTSPNGPLMIHCLMESGYGCCISLGQTLPVQPGTSWLLYFQALQSRWDTDSDQRAPCFGVYFGNGARLLSLPVTTALDPPGAPVTVKGFVTAFMLERPRSNTINSLAVEFQPIGVVAARRPTWGAIRLRYR